MTEVEEVWVPVPGFEGDYECSTHGRCRTVAKAWTVGATNASMCRRGPKLLKLYRDKYFRLRKNYFFYRLTPEQCKSIAKGAANERRSQPEA